MSRILVVEDELNVRKLVAVNLTSRGHTVFEANDVQQALEQLRANSFDLIVLDIKLPNFTGWDLLTEIAADAAIKFSSPVLVMTASIMDAHIDLEQFPLVVEVLVKPFSAAKLVTAVERALRATVSRQA